MREKSSLSFQPAFAPSRVIAGFFVPAFAASQPPSKSETRSGSRNFETLDMQQELNDPAQLVQLDPRQTFSVRKRDGRVVVFDETRIQLAIELASKADAGIHQDQALPVPAQNNVQRVANAVIQAALTRATKGDMLEIELLQDLVETQLMEAGHHSVARRYILYREDRRKARALRGDRTMEGVPQTQLFVTLPDHSREAFDAQRIRRR